MLGGAVVDLNCMSMTMYVVRVLTTEVIRLLCRVNNPPADIVTASDDRREDKCSSNV